MVSVWAGTSPNCHRIEEYRKITFKQVYLCHFVHGFLLLLGSVYSAEFLEHCCMFYLLNRVFDSLCFALILP